MPDELDDMIERMEQAINRGLKPEELPSLARDIQTLARRLKKLEDEASRISLMIP